MRREQGFSHTASFFGSSANESTEGFGQIPPESICDTCKAFLKRLQPSLETDERYID